MQKGIGKLKLRLYTDAHHARKAEVRPLNQKRIQDFMTHQTELDAPVMKLRLLYRIGVTVSHVVNGEKRPHKKNFWSGLSAC